MSGSEATLGKTYDWREVESGITDRWERSGVFHAEPVDQNQPRYSVVIPPPNVTAALHLGHGLNNALQDVLVRFHRMKGFATFWLPGTDHAGIATQTVVEKRLLSEGTKRLEMGREAFIERAQQWKGEYEAVILQQLKSMGASCDFERIRFTMDEMCATAVRHAFFALFQDGLIYRGKRLVNWDPVTHTALSDDEVEMEEVSGHMWYLTYPLADGSGSVVVATTRPETMLGDTAVAINPNDPRSEELVGKTVVLPIVGRHIPIVADDYVVMADPNSSDAKAQYASGFLKVTPAHDPNDWEIGLRHDLPVINIMGPDAAISDAHGWEDASDEARQFIGLSREDARTAIVEWFEANGLLAETRDYAHSVGHSYRSHVPIEPWLSDQWYVAVTDDRLRGEAMRAQRPDGLPPLPEGVTPRQDNAAGDGELRFHPDRYARTYYSWHDGIRDWCISRQLWWGHQIPVWVKRQTPADTTPEVLAALESVAVDEPILFDASDSPWVAAGAAHMVRRTADDEIEHSVCVPPDSTLRRADRGDNKLDESAMVASLEAHGYVRDPDVLDTWFSSGLWPMSTMGWPWPEDYPETVGLLDSYNPTSMLSTGREIITLWVSRMVMFNRYFLDGDVPFKDVFIHALVQDGHGQKMSKSLGNGVDPRDIIYSHGADAMRFTLVQMTTDSQDVRLPVDMVCPHSGQTFTPEFITTSAGHQVAAPIQVSPSDPTKKMVSAYGAALGLVEPDDETPLARNTSSKFDLGRNFTNKLWNTVRFGLKRVTVCEPLSEPIAAATLAFPDRWILTRLQQTVADLELAIERFQFSQYAETLYDFVWRDLSDKYLEAVKPTVDQSPQQQAVLAAVLDAVLRIMHPVCPFVTEALWPHVAAARCGEIEGVALPSSEVLAAASWPEISDLAVDQRSVDLFARADKLVGMIRSLRSERDVKPRQQITIHAPSGVLELMESVDGLVQTLCGVGEVKPLSGDTPASASPITFEGATIMCSGLVDQLDVKAELARLHKVVDAKTKQIAGFEGRLNNPGYVNNAKPELVEETRRRLDEARADLAAAETAMASLT